MISLETVLIRLVLALMLGALVGLEREVGERSAGLRTYSLVALGSCLIMIVSAFGFADILGTRAVVLDPSRIAAQVVSGIGFLGAGAILFRREIIQGLTTAAGIWVVAAIGLACGGGLLIEAVVVTLLTLFVLRVLEPLKDHLHLTSLYSLRIEATAADMLLLSRIEDACSRNAVKIMNVQVQARSHGDKLDVECQTNDAARLLRTVSALRAIAEIQRVDLTLRRADVLHLPTVLGDNLT